MSLSTAQKNSTYFVTAVLSATLLLSACNSSRTTVPVVDRNHSSSKTPPRPMVTKGQYVVRPGDTLYSIAFRFGWDYKNLAARNGIYAPYTIVPGQVIHFSSGKVTTVATTKPTNKAATSSTTTTVQPKSSATTASAPVVHSSGKAVTNSGIRWQWPATGPLLARFSTATSLNKGLDIGGQMGQAVYATANGTVVYAGGGLVGYGELVIIKHNDTYISAYGHSRKLLVKEGQQVKAGQQIAEMGSTGTTSVRLHFEIRKQGKPVDPLQYLPPL
ncbi:peptidoglycan DD-metalloendopeptidase family protein [Pseudomonas sp. F1_0610]|uniref:peptidoglycan DD-metalloendopeptidase family protein n=1 Tax=Pseudomonas sp. F1_0610 TaxID=3114284 RepID=UPI0039C1C14B